MEKKANNIILHSADLASFLFNCAWKHVFLGSVQKYYYNVQKNCLFWDSCRIITGQEPDQGLLESSAGPFSGSVNKFWLSWEIFTSVPSYPWSLLPISQSCLLLRQGHSLLGNPCLWKGLGLKVVPRKAKRELSQNLKMYLSLLLLRSACECALKYNCCTTWKYSFTI